MKTLLRKFPARLFAGALVALIIAGCASRTTTSTGPQPIAALTTPVPLTESKTMDPALLQRPSKPFTLGPGDRIEIEVLGDVATRARTVVGPDGKIYFYVLPGLDVWGLSLVETQQLISRELQNFVREPQPVALTLRGVESQRIWVLGRLASPGVYPISGPTTLLEAIALAGGPVSASSFASLTSSTGIGSRGATDEAADLNRSFVIREGRILPVDFNRLLREGDLSHNIYLQPDDFIYLPSARAQEVHVLGAVTQPRTVNYTNRLTLVQAVANAGGSIKDAHNTHVAIVRGSLSTPQISVVDYSGMIKGQTPDVLLEPNDIVYVPFTPYRTLTRYANLILDTFARAVGANEGSRAVARDGDAVTVGVNVPLSP
jgi:protein involved in polysaccharide export with SLBB domain